MRVIASERAKGPQVSVGTVQDGPGWMSLPWTAATWQDTQPMDIRVVKGERMIWIFAPCQRGVAMKSFNLKYKGSASPSQPTAAVAH